MSRVAVWAVALAAAVASGCGGMGRGNEPPEPVERVDAVGLWGVPPAAINWDDIPGPDGVQVRVFLYQAERPQPVLVKGTVELIMYPGRLHAESVAGVAPLRTWTFTPQELGTRLSKGQAGWGYFFRLGWGQEVPTTPTVTIVARYTPPKGSPVYSATLVIPIPK